MDNATTEVRNYETETGFMQVGRSGTKIHPYTAHVYGDGRRVVYAMCSCSVARTPNTYKRLFPKGKGLKTCDG